MPCGRPVSSGQDTAAISVFLDRVAKSRIQPDANSIVIVDELSQVGRSDMLSLLRLQAERGFTLYAIGDDKQIGAIEAPVMGSPGRNTWASAFRRS